MDRNDAITDFSFLHKPAWSPHDQDAMPLALAFTPGQEPVLPSDFRFEAHFEDPSDAFLDPYIEYFPRYGDVHQIGGHSSFCQDDPRPWAGAEHLIQLLQVDSGDHIDWGDGGTADFSFASRIWTAGTSRTSSTPGTAFERGSLTSR